MHKGRVVFGAMDEVVFGRPASETIVEQLDRLGAKRAFLMVSGTLNRATDEIAWGGWCNCQRCTLSDLAAAQNASIRAAMARMMRQARPWSRRR